MTLRELADLAKRTRDAQKLYFKTRGMDDLVRSKDLERKLDAAVDEVITGPTLFPDEEEGE